MTPKRQSESESASKHARAHAEAAKREMPTAETLERDAPKAVEVPARASKRTSPRGGERADNGSD